MANGARVTILSPAASRSACAAFARSLSFLPQYLTRIGNGSPMRLVQPFNCTCVRLPPADGRPSGACMANITGVFNSVDLPQYYANVWAGVEGVGVQHVWGLVDQCRAG